MSICERAVGYCRRDGDEVRRRRRFAEAAIEGHPSDFDHSRLIYLNHLSSVISAME